MRGGTVSTSAAKKKAPLKASAPAGRPSARKAPAKKAAPAKSARPAARKAPAARPPAATKPVVKPVKKGAAKPGTPPVPKVLSAKSAPAAAPAKPVKTPAKKPLTVVKAAAPAPATPAKAAPVAAKAIVAAPVPNPGAPIAFPAGVVPRKPGRGTPKYFVAPVQAPLPPPTSRFADRFAPPRPPTRQMNKEEIDTPREKQKADPKLANAWKTKSGRELTDAEILAMPDSEYMNDKQIEFFRVKLQALKDDLLSNAGETTEHLREDTSIVPDPADRATIEEEHALELRTRDRERKLLKKISQSLARLESGDYGFCDETGEPIGLGRLIARPTATLSLEAQQRRELKQKMFGD
jgi:DnaK suppressor protein